MGRTYLGVTAVALEFPVVRHLCAGRLATYREEHPAHSQSLVFCIDV